MQRISADEWKAIEEVNRHGQFVNGPEIELLEKEILELSRTKYAIACSSGTVALQMALMAAGISRGNRVLTTPFTFVATVEAIISVGAIPVFADINLGSFNIIIKDGMLKDVDAVIPVDCFGAPFNNYFICQQHRERPLVVIGDNAQSFGEIRSVYTGMPDMFCTSFHPSKMLNCCGDGGMVFTNNKAYYDSLVSIRNHGMGIDKYHTIRIGMNGRMDTIQAAILRERIKTYNDYKSSRSFIASKYKHALYNHVVFQTNNAMYSQFCILHANRDLIKERLEDAGYQAPIYYPVPIHLQDAYKFLGYKEGDFPVAESVCRRILALPMDVTNEQQDEVIWIVKCAL